MSSCFFQTPRAGVQGLYNPLKPVDSGYKWVMGKQARSKKAMTAESKSQPFLHSKTFPASLSAVSSRGCTPSTASRSHQRGQEGWGGGMLFPRFHQKRTASRNTALPEQSEGFSPLLKKHRRAHTHRASKNHEREKIMKNEKKRITWV